MIEVPVYTTLQLTLADKILDVQLNRPESANAMNAPMWTELQAAFEWADGCPGVRVVILSGAGKHFCAGIDLAMFKDTLAEHDDPARAAEIFLKNVRGLQANLKALQVCSKPVLAAMHGAVVGGAIDMTCYADMRYVDTSARFCVKEIDIGIVADVGTLQNLPSLIPEGLVRELAYTGRYMDAQEALSSGLVNTVFDDYDAMMVGVRAIAASIAAKSPLAIRGTKAVINYTRDHSVDDGLEYVALWNAAMMSKIDVQEAMASTLEKREAKFED